MGHGDDVSAAMPREIEGEAVDPIALEPVDEVIITTLVDNSYDGLLTDMGPARRPAMARTPRVAAPQFEQGETGRASWPSTASRRWSPPGAATGPTRVLFDTGVSPNGLADNLERLGLDAADIEAVVLSHGHFDHAGGFPGLARLRTPPGPADHRAPAGVEPGAVW